MEELGRVWLSLGFFRRQDTGNELTDGGKK